MIGLLCCLEISSHDYSLKKKSLMDENTTPDVAADPVMDTPVTPEETPMDAPMTPDASTEAPADTVA